MYLQEPEHTEIIPHMLSGLPGISFQLPGLLYLYQGAISLQAVAGKKL